MPVRTWMSAATVAVSLLLPATASAASARVAALQVALRAHAVYDGPVDGLAGPGTNAGVRRIQRRAGLAVDGIAGPRTRRALGAQGRHPIGSRPLRAGHRGWDVAALQFSLETHGFPLGGVDGGFGARTGVAVRRAQAFYGLAADGVAGPATFAALSRAPVRAPAAAPPDRGPARRPLRPARHDASTPASTSRPPPARPVTAAARGPRRLRRLRRRLGQHGRARPRQRRCAPATPTCPPSRSRSGPTCAPARRSAASARPASPPARTCTSRSRSAARTPTRASRSGSTDASGWGCVTNTHRG